MSNIERAFLINTESGTESASVSDIAPAVGAVSSAPFEYLCKETSTEPRVSDFPTFSAYLQAAERFSDPEQVADLVASWGPVQVIDEANGELHPDLPDAMRIPLGDGRFAVVDAEDYPLIKRHEWFVNMGGYAWTRMDHFGKDMGIAMHRLILMIGMRCSLDVDHINGDRLDNRKANLRACTRAENLWNQRISKKNTSGFKGVHWHESCQKWGASVTANGVRHVKYFQTLQEANEWARAKREELHGEFARHE